MITAATYQGKYEQTGDDTYRVLVRLVDDATGASDRWFTATGTTAAEIRDDVSRQIAALNLRRSTKGVLDGIANGTNIPVVAPAAAALAQAEIDRRAYFVTVDRLIHMQQLVAAGGMLANNAELTALQASVKAAYLPAYAGSF